MYKILLVDDEEMVIKSLKATVNWEEYGFEITDYALSAEEALDKLERLKPQVVITDIKMPNINGLELLQMIKSSNPGIYCVVISGYAEFAYIQKSIRLEAVGYCLKPFDADEIAVYLKRIRKKLDAAGAGDEKACCILDYMQSTTAEALANMNLLYKDKGIDFLNTSVCALYITGFAGLDRLKSLYSVSSGYQKGICLVQYEDLDEIMKELSSAGRSTVRAGISKPIQSFDKVPKAIREAKCCAFQYFCREDCGIVTKASDFVKDISFLQSLERELEEKDGAKVQRVLREIAGKFRKGEYNIDYAIRIQNIYASWLAAHYRSKEVDLVFEYETLCEIYPRVTDLLLQIEADHIAINNSSRAPANISNKTFLSIYQYLENNFTKPINIAWLAEEFHINACYFSQLFKKEMGCTFTDYIAKKRIEYAGKLLLETDMKINEIAEMAGFNDYFYFSRVFRKMKQCSPTEYRSS